LKTEKFCKEMDINEMVEKKIKNALIYASDKMTYFWLDPYRYIFDEFPIRLKYEFLVALYPELVLNCPFFSCFDISFVVSIIPLLKPIEFLSGEWLWKQGDYSSDIIFLTGGEVRFLTHEISAETEEKVKQKLENEQMQYRASVKPKSMIE
jgi:hypothetical protein